MIGNALFNAINTASPAIIPSGYAFAYGNGRGCNRPYVVLLKRDDQEDYVTLSDAKNPGNDGVFDFQVSVYIDDDPINTEIVANTIKDGMSRLEGVIQTEADYKTGTQTSYIVDRMKISGVIPMNEGGGVDVVCHGAVFTGRMTWHKF